jgi:hypothetical protein
MRRSLYPTLFFVFFLRLRVRIVRIRTVEA